MALCHSLVRFRIKAYAIMYYNLVLLRRKTIRNIDSIWRKWHKRLNLISCVRESRRSYFRINAHNNYLVYHVNINKRYNVY